MWLFIQEEGYFYMKTKVYIDGQSGTTGLQIYDRIGARDDLELLRIDEDKRHDPAERKKFLNAADIVFLCLPDAGAVEAVSMIENPSVRPGCHATGFISTVAPLVRMGILPRDYPVTYFSLTGYSGGGKKMIAQYEAEDRDESLSAPGIYGLSLHHKHVPEMLKMTGLACAPVFLPVVDDYYKGMAGTVMLQNRLLEGHPTAEEICGRLQDYYRDEHFVSVVPFGENAGTLYANELAGTNRLKIVVCGHEEQTTITALFDNLGKGASGAAVQNMNIMLGLDETTGLE